MRRQRDVTKCTFDVGVHLEVSAFPESLYHVHGKVNGEQSRPPLQINDVGSNRGGVLNDPLDVKLHVLRKYGFMEAKEGDVALRNALAK